MILCPHCNQKMKMLDVLGMDNWSSTACSYCEEPCMGTDRSLVLWFVVFLIIAGVVVFAASQVIEVNKLLAGFVALVAGLLTFPVIVRAKKYQRREYWLPKSRLLGCFVYLVVPVFVIVLALALAMHFEIGL